MSSLPFGKELFSWENLRMEWKNKRKLYKYIDILLTFVLVAGSLLQLRTVDTVEPPNVIEKEYENLNMEFMVGAETSEVQAKGNTQQKQETEEEVTAKSEEADETEDREEADGANDNSQKEENNQKSDTASPKESNGTKENGEQEEAGEGKNTSKGESSGEKGTVAENGTAGEKEEEGQETEDTSENKKEDEDTKNDNSDAGLVTDLQSKIITCSEIENDTLNFYAYYSDATVNANIRVNYKHEKESGNGTWLTGNGRDYSCKLNLGKNVITIYYDDAKGEHNYAVFTITYQAEKATEDEPVVGQQPPVIETNLDNWSGEILTQNFTFTVSAKTGMGEQIYSNHILVQMDGKDITNPTGNSIYEYVLYFQKPVVSETEEHKITVLAWDDAGNSKMQVYNVTYRSNDEGEVIGQVRVVVDATTVGVGIVADEKVDLIQGKPASYTLLAALEQMNFEYEFAGTEMIGFYIRSISRGNAFKKAEIPPELYAMIQKDEIEMRSPCSKNRLGEYDFTQGSGWLYSVNGGNYAGKGLSEWYLNDGDTLYMRFTVAYGKDIGGSESQFGRLQSYCGLWIDGGYIPLNHTYETTRVEPTETEDGYVEYRCSKCQYTYQEVLPCLGTEKSEMEEPKKEDDKEEDNEDSKEE